MASTQEPEVQFAQKLASNEKSIRTKAIKKLRKYINVRSQKATGGFASDELLKLWKGLFYCLWMQDKPLLQEELSKQISTLIHSFHDSDGQFLYLESFLLTFKREWTGIDRLRMDKFFQLVRFMFRQTFELLKKRSWEMSVVSRFLQLLVAQLLQSDSAAPSGLQLHILDLYMTELAAVGSAELTADQNLTFVEPFCRTAARTKDRTLFAAICNSIFSTIIDQAPFAIEDLMKEVKAAEDSESEELSDHEDQIKERTSNTLGKKSPGRQMNGGKSDEEDEDDDLLHFNNYDTELPGDDDIGPVLQFDYTALAEKLLELSGRRSTPSHNRQRLYKIIKVLRDLGEGIFPQDEYPEEVSTDEDDEMFGSRKRMKRGGGHMDKDEEGTPAAKKRKGKKKETSSLNKQGTDNSDPADINSTDEEEEKKKKKKKKKKAGKGGNAGGEGSEQGQTVAQAPSTVKGPEESPQCPPNSVSSVRVTAPSQGQTQTLLLSKEKKQSSVTVTEETSQPQPFTTDSKDQSQTCSKKKKRDTPEPEPEVAETGEQQSPAADAPVSGRKKKKSLEVESQVNKEAEIKSEIDALTPAKKKKKKKKKKQSLKAEAQDEVDQQHTNTEVTSEASPHTAAVTLKKTKKRKKTPEASPPVAESAVTLLKNRKKPTEEEERMAEETPPVEAEKLMFEITMTTPARKKKTPKATGSQTTEVRDETQLQVVGSVDAELALGETQAVSSSRKLKKRRKIPVVFEFEADEQEAALVNGLTDEETVDKKTNVGNDAEELSTPVSTKMSPKKAKTSASASDFITFQSNTVAPTPLFYRTKGSSSTPQSSRKLKKSQTPRSESKKVTFGLKNNRTAEFKKTDRSLLVSPDGSSRVAFDPKQKPKFGVLKSPPTPFSSTIKKTPNANRKKSLNTPKSTPKRRPSAADFF